tara:strand:- start:5667 stop:6647 length:981 start_codon:yes stop_codon:yes gene_type:complete
MKTDIKTGDKLSIWVLALNGMEIHHRNVTVFSVGTVEGREHVTANDFVVYTRYPLMDLITGEHTELWRAAQVPTKENEYPQRFDGWTVERAEHCRKPHPRTFEVFDKKLLPKADSSRIDGNITPGYVTGVIRDKGGHLWSGDLARCSVRMYAVRKEGTFDEPKIQFITPYLTYLGKDGDPIWWTEHWDRDGKAIKRRLTICDHAVRKLIEEAGLWGHYFPEGKARTDVEVAKVELQQVRERAWDYDKQKDRIAELEKEVAGAHQETEATAEKLSTSKQEAGELKTANDELLETNANLTREVEALRKRMNRPRGFDPLWSEPKTEGT